MKKWIFTLPLILVSFSSHGQNSDRFTGSLLWKVSGNGLEQPSYIFGTHHLAPLSFAQEYPGFSEALENAGLVVGELVLADMTTLQSSMMRHAVITDGTTYHSLLSESDYNLLDQALTAVLSAGLDDLGFLKPNMLNSTYTNALYSRIVPEYNPVAHVSIDQYVQDIAKQKKKKILGLETAEDQIQALFYTESLKEQAESLLCLVKNNHLYTEEAITLMNDYYARGDLYNMYALSFENPEDPCAMSEELARALNRNRNDHWMEQLPGIFADGPAFVAVGMLHLCGEEGLLYRLDQLGYTVEPVQ